MRTTLSICCALAAMSGSALADVVNIAGDMTKTTESTGSMFAGSLEYNYAGGNAGTLSISLTNTTPMGVGGYLTGFVFNLASLDSGASISLFSTSNANFLNTGSESAGPFGTFDAGAALGANFNGGGSPAAGLAMGDIGTFEFAVIATDASSLSAISFLGAGDDFFARFRGLTNGESDMVGTIPAPGTGALALIGLVCMTRRRR